MPKGYAVGYGWRGLMPSGEWRTFATEDEYLAAYHDALTSSSRYPVPGMFAAYPAHFILTHFTTKYKTQIKEAAQMAIRSTTKAAKEHIRAYILYRSADVDELGYDESIPRVTDPMNVKQIARAIIAVFRLEYGWNIHRIGEYNALKEWMRGLPSALNTLPLCTYHEARQLVAAWLEETPEEAARYDDCAVAEQALHLVARELLALAR